jgi:predicted deacylase
MNAKRRPDDLWIQKHPAPEVTRVDALDVTALATGRHEIAIHLVDNAASRPVLVPAVVLKGGQPGPTVGLTAAVHGNEINGIATIHRLFRTIDPVALAGAVVGVTIVNVPGYLRHQRSMPDGADLNRILPGRPDGNESEVYAHRLVERVLDSFDVLIDLHTASFGRENSLYVRADMKHEASARLARALGAEIIVHNEGADGSVRSSVADRGVPAITVEIGDPQVIDRAKVRISRIGIRDALEDLGMLPPDGLSAPGRAVECARSYWLFTDTGGILDVTQVQLTDRVTRGQVLATLHDPWGRRLRTYLAPEDGVVVGKSTNPVARTGARILHLGVVGAP